MSSDTIPQWIDPINLANKSASIRGLVAAGQMPRVAAMPVEVVDNVSCHFNFFMDEHNNAVIEGEIQAQVRLCCQRCMRSYTQAISAVFVLCPVADQSGKAHPTQGGYEPVGMEQGKVALIGLVEDELILSLPIVPKHADDDPVCVQPKTANANQELELASVESDNPFQVLELLKFKE